MPKAEHREVALRIVIEQPVVGVLYSLQAKDGLPLDPKRSHQGEPLAFDFAIRIGPGPKFFGDQVQREGPTRRFVYIRIGDLAGDPDSLWSRRMKIDVHDIEDELLNRVCEDSVVSITVLGTAKDGTPACATVRPASRCVVDRRPTI